MKLPLGLALFCSAAAAAPLSPPAIYVAEGGQGAVGVYAQAAPHQLLGTITDQICSAENVATDAAGTLYVASVSAALCQYNNIAVIQYPPGSATAARLLTQGLSSPISVAARGNTVFAGDYFNHNIEVFDARTGTISQIVFPYVDSPLVTGLGLDAGGVPYAVYLDATDLRGHVARYVSGQHGFHDLGIRLAAPGSLAFDASGNLILPDPRDHAVKIVTPNGTIVSRIGGFGSPVSAALNTKTRRLFVADQVPSQIVELSYPDGKRMDAFPVPEVAGLALSPEGH